MLCNDAKILRRALPSFASSTRVLFKVNKSPRFARESRENTNKKFSVISRSLDFASLSGRQDRNRARLAPRGDALVIVRGVVSVADGAGRMSEEAQAANNASSRGSQASSAPLDSTNASHASRAQVFLTVLHYPFHTLILTNSVPHVHSCTLLSF